jgi:hypothetical protein
VARIEDDIDTGCSGVLVCPSPSSPSGLGTTLEERSSRRDDMFAIDPGSEDICAGVSPKSAVPRLADYVIKTAYIHANAGTAGIDAFPEAGRITILVDARQASSALQGAWAQFAADVASATRSLPQTARPSVWVLTSPTESGFFELPLTDVTFRPRWWWGVLGPVDTALYTEDLNFDPEIAACALDVARWDLAVLDALHGWDGTVATLETYCPTPQLPDGLVPPEPDRTESRPPTEHIAAWGLASLFHAVMAVRSRRVLAGVLCVGAVMVVDG